MFHINELENKIRRLSLFLCTCPTWISPRRALDALTCQRPVQVAEVAPSPHVLLEQCSRLVPSVGP